jgi:hypothetical protein
MNNISMSTINKNKLTCTLTGKTVRVAPRTFDVRATKYGSVESLISNYVSAEGRKLLREGLSTAEIRARFNVSDLIPSPSAEIIARYTKWAKLSAKSQQVLETV